MEVRGEGFQAEGTALAAALKRESFGWLRNSGNPCGCAVGEGRVYWDGAGTWAGGPGDTGRGDGFRKDSDITQFYAFKRSRWQLCSSHSPLNPRGLALLLAHHMCENTCVEYTHAPDFVCDLECWPSFSLQTLVFSPESRVEGNFTPEGVGGTALSSPTSQAAPESPNPGENGGALPPRDPDPRAAAPPALHRWPKDAAAPGAGPAGGGRRLQLRLGAAVTATRDWSVGKQGRGLAPAAWRRGGGGCGQSPGGCCGGHGRPEPGAPRGRCGPERGEEREGLAGRSRASPLRAGGHTPIRAQEGSCTGRGPGHAPRGNRRCEGKVWQGSPENSFSFFTGEMEMVTKASPS